MSQKKIQLCAAASALTLLAFASAARADDYSSSGDYSHPYGMTSGNTNQPVTGDLRDSNGNLEVVNGQFVSSAMSQQSGVQNMNPLGGSSIGAQALSSGASSSSSVSTGGGVGGMTTVGTATAIGNSLNVITVGSNNTVVVDSRQTNNGNQTANATVNTGH